MSSEKVELQVFVIGMSSVLKYQHRKAKIPASLPRIVTAGIEAYWENGSLQGFTKLMAEKIVEVAINETKDLRAIPDRLYDKNSQADFILALYQEIYSFFELCFMDNYRYLAKIFSGSDAVTVIFARTPCNVTYVPTSKFEGHYKFTAAKIIEDEK